MILRPGGQRSPGLFVLVIRFLSFVPSVGPNLRARLAAAALLSGLLASAPALRAHGDDQLLIEALTEELAFENERIKKENAALQAPFVEALVMGRHLDDQRHLMRVLDVQRQGLEQIRRQQLERKGPAAAKGAPPKNPA